MATASEAGTGDIAYMYESSCFTLASTFTWLPQSSQAASPSPRAHQRAPVRSQSIRLPAQVCSHCSSITGTAILRS